MNNPIVIGNEWRRIWDGENGLSAAFDHIEKTYFDRAGQLGPEQADLYHALAVGASIVRMVKAHALGIIETGDLAKMDAEAALKFEELTPYQKRSRAI